MDKSAFDVWWPAVSLRDGSGRTLFAVKYPEWSMRSEDGAVLGHRDLSREKARVSVIAADGEGRVTGASGSVPFGATRDDVVAFALASLSDGAARYDPDILYPVLSSLGLTGLTTDWGDAAVSLSWLRPAVSRTAEFARAEQIRLNGMGLDAVLDVCGPERFRSYDLGLSVGWEAHFGGMMRMPRAQLTRLLALGAAYPPLASLVTYQGARRPLGEEGDPTLFLADMLGLPADRMRPLLRRLSAPHVVPSKVQMKNSLNPLLSAATAFAMLGEVPVDWCPGREDVAGWAGLFDVTDPLVELRWVSGRPLSDLVSNCKGRWSDYADRMHRAAGTRGNPSALSRAARDTRDMAASFERQVLLPLRARAALGTDADIRSPAPPADKAEGSAGALLFRDMSATRILEESADWHRRSPSIQAAIAATRPAGSEDVFMQLWPAGFPSWTDDATGVRIVPLVDQEQLAAEGGRGTDGEGHLGLEHCVGGYGSACASGRTRILSLRGPDGTRLSTAEVRLTGERFPVVQHRGRRNGDPPASAAEALGRYLSGCEEGRIEVDRSAFAPLPSGKSAARECGYDWRDDGAVRVALDAWAPYLPRPLRGLSPDDFADRVGLAPPASPFPLACAVP